MTAALCLGAAQFNGDRYNGQSLPMEFRGVYASLTTPFDHQGDIYWSKVRHNVGRLNRTNLSGYVVGDSWGEGALLTASERARLWNEVVLEAEEGRSVIASIGPRGVNEARTLCDDAAEAKCQAVLLTAPDLSTIAPSSHSSAVFFRAVADDAELPVVLNVQLGGERATSVDEIAQLAAHPRIVGAVVSANDPAIVNELCESVGNNFTVVVRGTRLMEPCLSAGASAVVTAMAAAVPFYCLSIEEAIRTRELEAARELTATAHAFDDLLTQHGVPTLKHALDLRGHYGGIPRLPLLRISKDLETSVEVSLRELAS